MLGDGQKVIAGGEMSVLLFPPDMKEFTGRYERTTPLGVTSYNDDEFIVIGQNGMRDKKLYSFHFLKTSDSKLTKCRSIIKSIRDYKIIAITSCNNKIYALFNTDPPALKHFMRNQPDPILSHQTGEDGNALLKNPTCITSFNTRNGIRLEVADRLDDNVVNLVLLIKQRDNCL